VLNVNLKSVFLLSQNIIPFMKKSGGGSIINTGSGWGLKGGPKAAAYCAAKGGVVNLTRAMAIDFGKDNIRVNCICPGDVETPLLYGEAVQLGREISEFMKEAADRPLGRMGQPQEIANAVLYFASDLSSWTTGSILVVDGGGLA
jgi:NAD(P)-dependent dehydrogenase (short-subunit alcohol dehydrogenase family)